MKANRTATGRRACRIEEGRQEDLNSRRVGCRGNLADNEGASMAREWYVRIGGKELGPLSSAALKQFVADGEVTPETPVKPEASGSWVAASQVKGLFPSSTNGAAPPPIPSFGPISQSRKSTPIARGLSPVQATPDLAVPTSDNPEPMLPIQGLMNCPDCGRPVSPRASACPGCGAAVALKPLLCSP